MASQRNIEVWKFTMGDPRSVFQMPSGAEVLSVGPQGDDIVIWAEVNPTVGRIQRVFTALNTGQQLPVDRLAFIGTVQVETPLGPVVWHVYEVER